MFTMRHGKTPLNLEVQDDESKERKEPHLRTAQGHSSFLVSQILPYSFESLKMGKEDVPIESKVQCKRGSHLRALSRHYFRALISKNPHLSLPATLLGIVIFGEDFASFPFLPSVNLLQVHVCTHGSEIQKG